MRNKLHQMSEAWCACTVIQTSLQELWPEYSMALLVPVTLPRYGVDVASGELTSVLTSN